MYQRPILETLKGRMMEIDNMLLQVLVGPRQTGKSTMLAQTLSDIQLPAYSISADDEIVPSSTWLQQEWQQARNLQSAKNSPVLFVVDEVQKIPDWENTVKGLWDADRRNDVPLKVILSGSSSLLIHKGLADSLMGRFELIHSPHWSYAECRDAFGYTLDDFLYYGGYPGAARFADDEQRWRAYIRDAVIEPTIRQDVLEKEQVRKPALLRALFLLGTMYSGQELSYNKMLGQLQDSGNAETLAHYLMLLGQAGMLSGLQKYDPKELIRRKSSPRLMVHDTALMSAATNRRIASLAEDSEYRGHVVESAVGAYLMARGISEGFKVTWWREGNKEVDFVVDNGEFVVAIEVKSGRKKAQGGMAAFLKAYPKARRMIVGGSSSGAYTLDDFLLGNFTFPWEE